MREPFEDLDFMAPLSPTRADRLVRFVSAGLTGTVLDIGCGWAELLLRVVAAAPDARGIGIDSDEAAIEHGQQLATQRILSDRVTLVCGDAVISAPESADAVICIGASHIWGPPVEANQPLDYTNALSAIRAKVSKHARVVYGEGIWSRPPTPAATESLGGRLDEFVSLPELVKLAVQQEFTLQGVHEASIEEWDAFESGYCARFDDWLAENQPDSADAAEIRRRADRQRDGYLGGYRGILGMAYLELTAA